MSTLFDETEISPMLVSSGHMASEIMCNLPT